MPFTAHLRKRESKSGITTYQIVAEEEAEFSTGKRKRFYRTVKGSKKEAEKAMRNFINELETHYADIGIIFLMPRKKLY